jgi:hypothetical protein
MRAILSRKLVALSKPRCGSTSLRKMLDTFVDKPHGDLAVDRGGIVPDLHPHITGPALRAALTARGLDLDGVTFIITTRHPVDMLWSCYKFFKPDENSRYSFSRKWSGQIGMTFEDWIMKGSLPVNAIWSKYGPDWVTGKDLSSLSLEYRAMNKDGSMAVDHVFQLEDLDSMATWLEEYLRAPITRKHVNGSTPAETPKIGHGALDWVKHLMPMEAKLYNL